MPPDLPVSPRRRALGVTSLIDVIFLLLLFFMLTSTFSRHAEIDLVTAAGGGTPVAAPPLYLRLGPAELSVNGADVSLAEVPGRIGALSAGPRPAALVALRPEVSAQRLVDLLVRLREVPDLTVTVLGR